MSRERTRRRTGAWRLMPVVVGVATLGLVACAGTAYAVFTATATGTGDVTVGVLSAPTLSLASHTPTSATLTWTAPSNNPSTTTWLMTETGSAVGSGTCAGTKPTSPCTVTGLAASTTYSFQLTYTLHTWHTSSNTVAVKTTASSTCGSSETVVLTGGSTAHFSLVGGGGGNGAGTSKGNALGGSGAPGASITGKLVNNSDSPVTLTFVGGCKGATGTDPAGGAGGANGYASGGAGGTAHATPKSGGGGGGGSASFLRLTVAGTTTVIAVASGGGGGGGAAFNNGNSGTPGTSGTTTVTTKTATSPANGLTGISPSTGHTPGGGGGGGGVKTEAAGGASGKGGTGGFNYIDQGTVKDVTVTLQGPTVGTNPHATGSFTYTSSGATP